MGSVDDFTSSQAFDELAATTLDQLRSLVEAYDRKSIRAAAISLGREQASVAKQLDTLNRRFGQAGPTRQDLFHKPPRGGTLTFTRSGEIVVRLARATLKRVEESHLQLLREAGEVKVGAPTFMVPLLVRVWQRWVADVEGDLHLTVQHVSSDNIPQVLIDDPSMDFCFGGRMLLRQQPPVDSDSIEYREFTRETICILTNLHEEDLRGPISVETLRERRLSFVLPQHGPIAEFARTLYGPDLANQIVLEQALHVFFIISSLKYRIYRGSMFATQTISRWADHFWTGEDHAAEPLRTIEIEADPCVPVMSVGLFRRATDGAHAEDHPLQRLWSSFLRVCDEQAAAAP